MILWCFIPYPTKDQALDKISAGWEDAYAGLILDLARFMRLQHPTHSTAKTGEPVAGKLEGKGLRLKVFPLVVTSVVSAHRVYQAGNVLFI